MNRTRAKFSQRQQQILCRVSGGCRSEDSKSFREREPRPPLMSGLDLRERETGGGMNGDTSALTAQWWGPPGTRIKSITTPSRPFYVEKEIDGYSSPPGRCNELTNSAGPSPRLSPWVKPSKRKCENAMFSESQLVLGFHQQTRALKERNSLERDYDQKRERERERDRQRIQSLLTSKARRERFLRIFRMRQINMEGERGLGAPLDLPIPPWVGRHVSSIRSKNFTADLARELSPPFE